MALNARLLAEREFARDMLADRLCAALEEAAPGSATSTTGAPPPPGARKARR
jgi:hypothetical protein